MPVNPHPEYLAAEGEYLQAYSIEEKIERLKKMISLAPSHKGAENLRAQLKTRLKKLQEKQKKEKTKRGKGKAGIKKESMQAVIIGKTNTGRSSLLSLLTNASPEIAYNEQAKFTTKYPVVGMMSFEGASIQLIENPAIESEFYDKGLTNTADTLLILINNLSQIQEIEKHLEKSQAKKIIVFNKTDSLSENEKRKISATLSSKKYNFVLISTKIKEGTSDFARESINPVTSEVRSLEILKDKILQSFNKIRVYTKEPGKEIDKTKNKPIILEKDATVKDIAEKILKGFSSKIKKTKIWGPSSKFPGQIVGLNHELKDLDVVEFKTG